MKRSVFLLLLLLPFLAHSQVIHSLQLEVGGPTMVGDIRYEAQFVVKPSYRIGASAGFGLFSFFTTPDELFPPPLVGATFLAGRNRHFIEMGATAGIILYPSADQHAPDWFLSPNLGYRYVSPSQRIFLRAGLSPISIHPYPVTLPMGYLGAGYTFGKKDHLPGEFPAQKIDQGNRIGIGVGLNFASGIGNNPFQNYEEYNTEVYSIKRKLFPGPSVRVNYTRMLNPHLGIKTTLLAQESYETAEVNYKIGSNAISPHVPPPYETTSILGRQTVTAQLLVGPEISFGNQIQAYIVPSVGFAMVNSTRTKEGSVFDERSDTQADYAFSLELGGKLKAGPGCIVLSGEGYSGIGRDTGYNNYSLGFGYLRAWTGYEFHF
ncbi:MAG: hypothetical protein H6581_12740 [Bacteroidia bacterium]|nr:hypothetical protein [Bacteroidia bacterium]